MSAIACSLQLGIGARAVEKTYEPGLVMPPHEHDYSVIVMPIRGEFFEDCKGKQSLRKAGEVRILRAGVTHKNRYGNIGASSFLIELTENCVSDLSERGLDLPEAEQNTSSSASTTLTYRMLDELRIGDRFSPMAIEALLLEFLVRRNRDFSEKQGYPAPSWLAEAREYIELKCLQPISVTEIAAAVNASPLLLARMFRTHYGFGTLEFLQRCRIARTVSALRDTNTPIATIALDAGFADQAHFTRRFRLIMGQTPGAYRTSRGAGTTRNRRLG
jgi:AraC family transcriptional regulator